MIQVYVTQEKAMAPGIVREWPNVIPHPTDRNGRLVKKSLTEIIEEMSDNDIYQLATIITAILSQRDNKYDNNWCRPRS